MRTRPQLPNVSSPRGAPMGRARWHSDTREPARCFRLRIVDGDYDEGGAYWGFGMGCQAVYCGTNGSGYQDFCRAGSRIEAKLKLRAQLPTPLVLRWKN